MSGHAAGERLSAYLDRELSERDRAEVEAHLRECPACARELSELIALQEAALDLPVTAPPGYFDSFPARVRERLAPAPARRAVPAWTWAAAAALLLAVVTPLTLRDRPGPVSSPSPAPARGEESWALRAPAASPPAPVGAPVAADEPHPAPATAKAEGAASPAASPAAGLKVGAGGARAKEGPARAEGRLAQREQARELDEAVGTARPQAPAEGTVAPGATVEEEAPAPVELRTAPVPEAKRHDPPAQAAPAPAAAGKSREPIAPPAKPEAPPPAPQASNEAEGPLTRKRAATADAKASAPKAQDRFADLQKVEVRDAAQARRVAEAWRRHLRDHPHGEEADQARVGLVEALAAAWRLGGQESDRAEARREATAYLERKDARQKERVRALLQGLDR